MQKKLCLPEEDLSHNYHILKLMTHSIYSIPSDGISPDEIIEKTKQWLGISPFKKKRLTNNLNLLCSLDLISKESVKSKHIYTITPQGRRTYEQYVDVMTVWKLEQNFGSPFQLHTVSEVFRKSKKHPATFIPETAFYDWPLSFKPNTHSFEGTQEIRSFNAFENAKTSAADN